MFVVTKECNHNCISFTPENIDGEWSEWGDWSICAADFCSYGNITRNRTCDNPPPKNKGKDCEGSSINITTCYNDSCPSN